MIKRVMRQKTVMVMMIVIRKGMKKKQGKLGLERRSGEEDGRDGG